MTNLQAEKQNYRDHATAHRDRLDVDDTDFETIIDIFLTEFSDLLCHHDEGQDLKALNQKDSDLRRNDSNGVVISAYWPTGKEFDVRFLLDELTNQGFTCALPCVEKESRILKFKKWNHDTQMVQGVFDILEPGSGEELIPDIVIAPLLAFDQKGYRLGYGGGYYDATLTHLREQKDVTYIGVGFAEQAVLFKLPREDHDIPLDYMLTPKGVIDFKER